MDGHEEARGIAVAGYNVGGQPQTDTAICDECGAPAFALTVARTKSCMDAEGNVLSEVAQRFATERRTSRTVVEIVYSCPQHEHFLAEELTARRGISGNRYERDELAWRVSEANREARP